jgi:hypothetical protein
MILESDEEELAGALDLDDVAMGGESLNFCRTPSMLLFSPVLDEELDTGNGGDGDGDGDGDSGEVDGDGNGVRLIVSTSTFRLTVTD